MIETPTLLDRFLRYVRIDTEAREGSPTYPSSAGQWDLAKLLVEELNALKLPEVKISEFGIVTATIPATIAKPAPTIAWIAHMDTSPETSGKNVKPIVHEKYDGRDIVLPGNPLKILKFAENPDLAAVVGKTLITTDGTTLLGCDNKGGVAVIMETAAYLMRHPEIPHGKIRICFTCDEEIGKGIEHVHPDDLGAVAGYTLDGGGQGEIEAETFSADKALITITGVNIHPSIGKGRMTNAVRLAGMFLDRLPQRTLSPETTEGREGFVHPYKIEGGVAEVKIHLLMRDFITNNLRDQERMLKEIASHLELEYPTAKIHVEVSPQYRNMADGIDKEPRVVPYAVEAMKRLGIEPKLGSIRGGTDGSQLTAKGLPTPNLSTGEHNIHSPLEWACLEELQTAVAGLVELAQIWAE